MNRPGLHFRSLGRAAVLGAVVGGAGVGAFLVPLPMLFEYLPGPVRDVGKLVEVREAKTYSSEGTLYMTTVSVDTDVTFVDMLGAAVDPERAVVLESQVTGGSSLEQLQRVQAREMEASKQHAREVALAAAGYGEPQSDGARVVAVQSGGPADGVIQKGDVILSIDGVTTETTCDVGAEVDGSDIGEQLVVAVRRRGHKEDLRLRTAADPRNPTAPYVGIVMQDIDYRFEPGVEVNFETGKIAGPSAGLMFALALYDRLTPEDLSAGRTIAGTGTIECDGEVGPIGGIEQKVAGAEKHGADIFLAPEANARRAQDATESMNVVAVGSFDDAVEYLEGLE